MEGGRVTLVVGPMFSGKTEWLIKWLQWARERGQIVGAFKPRLDDRYSTRELVSHNGQWYPALPVKRAWEILRVIVPGTTKVAIDEAQFSDPSIIPVVQRLAGCGIEVAIAGLNLDFRREPFGCMPQLKQAVTKLGGQVLTLTATCAVCGREAAFTQRLIDDQPAHYDSPVVLVGGAEFYEPRCSNCHKVPGKPK